MPRPSSAASSRAATRAAEDRRMAARLALEDHWAVAALPIADRERARALAHKAWRRGAPRLGEDWPARDRELLTRVTQTYEIAALEDAALLATALRDVRRLGIAPARLATDEPASSDDVASHAALVRLADAVTSVRGAADVTFMFARVAPLPRPWDSEHLSHVLRLVALGAVAGDATALRRWLDAARAARRSPDGSEPLPLGQPWDAQLRETICALWLELAPTLLLGADPAEGDASDALERAFETIASLREQRLTREAEQFVTLPEAMVPSMRARVQVLYSVLDATAHLVVWARRSSAAVGVPAARDALQVSTAFTAGDRTLDTALQWLDLAIALPPLAASLPPAPIDRAR